MEPTNLNQNNFQQNRSEPDLTFPEDFPTELILKILSHSSFSTVLNYLASHKGHKVSIMQSIMKYKTSLDLRFRFSYDLEFITKIFNLKKGITKDLFPGELAQLFGDEIATKDEEQWSDFTIPFLPNLKTVDLYTAYCSLDKLFEIVSKANISSLTLSLDLEHNLTKDELNKLIEISNHCKKLNSLNLYQFKQTSPEILTLFDNPFLESLVLFNWLTLTTLPFNTKHPHLKSVHIQNCPNITSESLIEMSNNCPSIERFTLTENNNINSGTLKTITKNFPSLEHLKLNSCYFLTGDSIKAITTHCPKLKILQCDRMQNITEDTLKTIGDNCKELEILDLNYFRDMTENSINYLINNCKNLKEIYFFRNKTFNKARTLKVEEREVFLNIQELDLDEVD